MEIIKVATALLKRRLTRYDLKNKKHKVCYKYARFLFIRNLSNGSSLKGFLNLVILMLKRLIYSF